MAEKALTVRLSADLAEQLEIVASVDELPVSEVIRVAIAQHIESRKSHGEFQSALRARIRRAEQMLTDLPGVSQEGGNQP